MRILIIVLSVALTSCAKKEEKADIYPLLSLFDASESLEGETVRVVGYFGYWDGDIPVLYATRSDYKSSDGLYKAHLMFYEGREGISIPGEKHEGKICIFRANVWYKYRAPTLDNASLVKCTEPGVQPGQTPKIESGEIGTQGKQLNELNGDELNEQIVVSGLEL